MILQAGGGRDLFKSRIENLINFPNLIVILLNPNFAKTNEKAYKNTFIFF